MPLDKFSIGVLETERKKLRAVQDKLPQAIGARDIAKVSGLAQAAEKIANRLIIILDQQRLGKLNGN